MSLILFDFLLLLSLSDSPTVHMRERMGHTSRLLVLCPRLLIGYSDESFADMADVPAVQDPQKAQDPQKLQELEEHQTPQTQQPLQPEEEEKLTPVCACCYEMHQFPVSPFSQAFPQEELEQRERLAPLPTQCKSPVGHTVGSL